MPVGQISGYHTAPPPNGRSSPYPIPCTTAAPARTSASWVALRTSDHLLALQCPRSLRDILPPGCPASAIQGGYAALKPVTSSRLVWHPGYLDVCWTRCLSTSAVTM